MRSSKIRMREYGTRVWPSKFVVSVRIYFDPMRAIDALQNFRVAYLFPLFSRPFIFSSQQLRIYVVFFSSENKMCGRVRVDGKCLWNICKSHFRVTSFFNLLQDSRILIICESFFVNVGIFFLSLELLEGMKCVWKNLKSSNFYSESHAIAGYLLAKKIEKMTSLWKGGPKWKLWSALCSMFFCSVSELSCESVWKWMRVTVVLIFLFTLSLIFSN